MALQVWLPLRGDIHNQGLYPLDFTNTNATVAQDGCLGPCYSFTATTGTGIYCSTAAYQNFLNECIDNHSFSLCCFFKTTETSRATPPISITYGVRIFVGTANTLSLYNTARTVTVTSSENTADGKWHHVCGTYNAESGDMKLYIDGILKATNTYTAGYKYVHTWNNAFYIGRNPNDSQANASYFYQGSVNDVRFYDHELSAKEVKEISKGLVQHFKLDETYGMTNLFAGKTFNVYNNYGTGMTCVQEDTGETYMGQPVRRFTYTIVNSSCASGFKSGYGSRGVYVGQCYFGASGTSIPFVYWIYYRPQTNGLTAGGTASKIGGWSLIPSEYVGDGWYRVGQYRTGNSSTARTSDNVFTSLNWPYAGIGSSCTIDFTVAGYLISGTTEIPENFVEGNSVVHDCSGFGNDGTVYGTLKPVNDSAKYCGSTYIGTNNAVVAGRGGMVRHAITVAIWAYMSSWSSYNGRLASCTEGGGWNFEPSSSKMNFAMGTGVSSNTYKSALSTRTLASLGSGWHHFAGTYDGFTTKIYIDGVLEGTNAAYTEHTPIYYANNAVFVGAEAASSQVNPTGSYFNGNLSDFRIYGTALSAEDILELYHTPASIDNHGNFYCGEIKEV